MLRAVPPPPSEPLALRRISVCEGLTVGIDQVGEYAHAVLLVVQPSGRTFKHVISPDFDNFEVLSDRVDAMREGCLGMVAAGFVLPVTALRAV